MNKANQPKRQQAPPQYGASLVAVFQSCVSKLLCSEAVCSTEKATEARHRLERQYNACAKRKKQCRPNETKPYSNATHPRKRQNDITNGHTPSRNAHTSHVHRDAPARTRSPGGSPPSTCTHSVTTRRRCGRNDKHESPREPPTGTVNQHHLSQLSDWCRP